MLVLLDIAYLVVDQKLNVQTYKSLLKLQATQLLSLVKMLPSLSLHKIPLLQPLLCFSPRLGQL